MALTKAEVRRLVSALKSEQARMEALANRAEDELAKRLIESQARAYRRIREIIVDGPRFQDLTANKRLEWWVRSKGSVEKALIENGYGDAVKSFVDELPEFLDIAGDMLTVQPDTEFLRFPQRLVKHYQSLQLDRFSVLGADANAEIMGVVHDAVFGGVVKSKSLENLKGIITGEYPWGSKLGRYEWHAGTYARTAHFAASREMKAQQADDLGVENFLYVGPNDSKTRSFCSERVGKVFTRKQIEAMDNGQGLSVRTYGGGWNCRHDWVPVTEGLARALKEQSAG